MKPEFGNPRQIAILRTERELEENGSIKDCTGVSTTKICKKGTYIYFNWNAVSMGTFKGEHFYELDEDHPNHDYDLVVRGHQFMQGKTEFEDHPFKVPIENIIKCSLL